MGCHPIVSLQNQLRRLRSPKQASRAIVTSLVHYILFGLQVLFMFFGVQMGEAMWFFMVYAITYGLVEFLLFCTCVAVILFWLAECKPREDGGAPRNNKRFTTFSIVCMVVHIPVRLLGMFVFPAVWVIVFLVVPTVWVIVALIVIFREHRERTELTRCQLVEMKVHALLVAASLILRSVFYGVLIWGTHRNWYSIWMYWAVTFIPECMPGFVLLLWMRHARLPQEVEIAPLQRRPVDSAEELAAMAADPEEALYQPPEYQAVASASDDGYRIVPVVEPTGPPAEDASRYPAIV